MGFLSRLFEAGDPPPPPPPPGAVGGRVDILPSLRERVVEVVDLVNRHGDVLPTIGSALARRTTDDLATVLERDDVTRLGPHAMITLRGVVSSYLPDTIETYVAAVRSGHPDDVALMQQLTALHHSVEAILNAVREGDAHAMEVQHAFLTTKFTESDLDL